MEKKFDAIGFPRKDGKKMSEKYLKIREKLTSMKYLKSLKDRNAMISDLVDKGESASRIAKTFDVSRSRVHQIHQQIKFMRENFDNWPPLRQKLSKRTVTLLTKFYGESIFDNPHILVNLGRSGLLRIKNIGLKTIIDISAALFNMGLIKKKENW